MGILLACRRDGRAPSRSDQAVLDMAAQLATIGIEQHELHQRLLFYANHDSLTGLPNRRLLDDRLSQSLTRARRSGTAVAVLQIDLDRFKFINDSLGHAAGDALLKAVAGRLIDSVRSSDTLARIGGDEFTLVLPDLKRIDDGHRVAEELIHRLQQPFIIQGSEVFITSSIGIAYYPNDATDPVTLVKKADAALYRAKYSGKNRWHDFAPETQQIENRLELESGLRRALERNELEVFYQPIFDAADQSVSKMEALLRWKHPRLGFVSPGQFIPIAEETGLIIPIGKWVLERACRDAIRWQSCSHTHWKVSVNVSAVQLARNDLAQVVSSVLEETGLESWRLELELTETVVMQDIDLSVRQMRELRALGVSIAIDDFGTGYSTLNYLQRLPVDCLKIDQSFVREMSAKVSSTKLVEAMIRMAHVLDLKVTAEGIETASQLSALQRFGCDQVQGFYLGKPVPLSDISEQVDHNDSPPIKLAS